MLNQLFSHQQKIGFSETSGLQRIFQLTKGKKKDKYFYNELETDQGILDFVLNLVNSEEPKIYQSLVSSLIVFEHKTDDIKFLKFYGELLFSILKTHSSNEKIENFVLTNEVLIYKKFKGGDKPFDALLLFIFKLL